MGTELAVLHVLEAVFRHLGKEQLVASTERGGFAALIKLGR